MASCIARVPIQTLYTDGQSIATHILGWRFHAQVTQANTAMCRATMGVGEGPRRPEALRQELLGQSGFVRSSAKRFGRAAAV